MNLKKLLSLALAGVMTLSLAVPAFAAEETLTTEDGMMTISVSALEEDTPSNAEESVTTSLLAAPAPTSSGPWYTDAVNYVMEHAIMSGTDKGFEPELNTNRASVFQTLYNMEGRPAVTRASAFTDVAGTWYANTAAWAETNGLAIGDEHYAFNGDRLITRNELVTILYRYAQHKNMDVTLTDSADILSFADVAEVQSWAMHAFQWAVTNGLISGDENRHLVPLATANRAQLATILTRLDKLVGEGKTAPEKEPEKVPEKEPEKETMDLQILATSDLHGKFYPWDYAQNVESTSGSMTQLATAIKELRTENTLLVDAGDTIQDNSANIFLDEDVHPMIAAMNALGYDTWTTGNHEYNYGMDTLKKVIATSKAKVLTGNVYDEDGKAIADGYTIIEKNGVKVGIIGMVTQNITRWDAANLAKCKVTDPVEETKKIIADIKDDVDVLIAVMHMGIENEYDVANSGVTDLAKECPELDLIVASHEHMQVEGTELSGILTVENKNMAQTLNEIHLFLEKDEDGWKITDKTSKTHQIKEYESDPELLELLKPYHEYAVKDASTVIGKLEGGDLAPANEINGVPAAQLMDTAMMDLINEVQLYYTGAKVSAAALFTTDANLKEGDIKKSDSSLIYKFDNTLYKLEMTGKQLKTYMEWSVNYYNQYHDGDLTISFNPDVRSYLYDMFAGVDYDVDISKPAGERITNLVWSDTKKPVKDDETFEIAVNNYRANSQLLTAGVVYEEGDTPVLLEKDVHGEIGGVREQIREYINTVKKGVLTPEVDNNWKIIGNNWDEKLHEKAVEQINSGLIDLPTSADGRTPNAKSVTVDDLK